MVIVEYITIIHSDIPNYTKLAFNSLKMIPNDTVSQPIKQEPTAAEFRKRNLQTAIQKSAHVKLYLLPCAIGSPIICIMQS